MAALDKILFWAQKEIPAWQADAVRRFLLCESLSIADKNELYLMMKVHEKLLDASPDVPKAVMPSMEGLSGSAKPGDTICLKSINCIANVNAIPALTELPIGHKGVTIIYGENGTGKSGFARVLKRACNARDKSDEVLGDIFGKTFSKKPKVQFKLDINEKVDSLHDWEEGLPTQSILSKITVFDSKCARVIIDNRNEYQYKPYGTHVFEELAKLCEELKMRLDNEKPLSVKPILSNLIQNTAANNFYLNINSKTTEKELSVYEKWTDEEDLQLNYCKEWLDAYKKQDINSKVNPLKATIKKYIGITKATRSLTKDLSSKVIESINSKLTEYNSSAEAQKIAESAISSSDFPLLGVKTKAWRQLFEAAEQYSKLHAYPGIDYPSSSQDALCVLCMQSLSETAKNRMRTFKEFMLDEVGSKLKEIQNEIDTLSKKYGSYSIRDLKELEIYIADLQNTHPHIVTDINKIFTHYHTLLKSIQDGIGKRAIIPIPPEMLFVRAPLFSWLKSIKKQIQDYEALNKPEEVQKWQKNYDELLSKKLIHQSLRSLKDYILSHKLSEKFQQSINALDTTKISKKGRTLIAEECTPELQSCLQTELNRLGARSFEIKFKPRGEKGVTLHEFEFEGAVAKYLPSKILSEGEQKAVAIAGFFAELSLSKHICPVVFDDPVTSLDHIYREKIAERIASESLNRQIIVFTHDIVFLHEIEKHLGRVSGCMSVITLKRLGSYPGKVFSSQPWHALKVKDRLAYLEQLIPSYLSLFETDVSAYNTEAANWYNLFRETWEAIVEEQLLAGAVQRFNTDVKTQNLMMIEITDDDYRTVDLYMAKSSEWMYGHNKSQPQAINRPVPSELRKDLDSTRTFLEQTKQRNKKNQERRKSLLKPQPSLMG